MSKVLLLLAALLAGLSGSARAGDDDFYAVAPDLVPGPPGSIIRMEGRPDIAVTKSFVWRIVYRSTGFRGNPIAVSATVLVPFARPPEGGWPVIAWAHGTTGIVPKCGPSKLPDPLLRIPGVDTALTDHYVIIATDYQGLGVGPAHPYLIGESEGRGVLDSIRAVQQMPEAHAGLRTVLLGFSQGGHAVLWANQIAPAYAPELDLIGVAAFAPPTYLGELFTDDYDDLSGRILTGLVLESWSDPDVYALSLDSMIVPREYAPFHKIGDNCIDLVLDELSDLAENRRIPKDFLKADPATTPPWSTIMAQNIPSAARSAVPFYIAQGTADTTVDAPVTVKFVRRMCEAGNVVAFEK
ncbi:MAG: lipase, partial [Rhizobiales bacterium]|nr:lipase [Hyphomicrobiales bacterium]